jgi:uncharacterized HAD superfamily protein
MVPATIIATQLNIPMADPDGLCADRLLGVGSTKTRPDFDRALSDDRTILVVDDVAGSGRAFREVKARFEEAGIRGNIVYCAIYAPMRHHPDVDVVLQVFSGSFMSQWNVMFHSMLDSACVDIDGVLCPNPAQHEDDDGPRYAEFLRDAPILMKTGGRIGYLVTSRRERYRAATVDWLSRNGVRFDKLVMWPDDDGTGDSAVFKAQVYKESGATLFIESEADVAERIAAISGRPVLSIATQQIVMPGELDPIWQKSSRTSLRQDGGLSRFKLSLRRWVGNRAYYFFKNFTRRA